MVTKIVAGSSIVFCHLPQWQNQTSESFANCHVRFLLVPQSGAAWPSLTPIIHPPCCPTANAASMELPADLDHPHLLLISASSSPGQVGWAHHHDWTSSSAADLGLLLTWASWLSTSSWVNILICCWSRPSPHLGKQLSPPAATELQLAAPSLPTATGPEPASAGDHLPSSSLFSFFLLLLAISSFSNISIFFSQSLKVSLLSSNTPELHLLSHLPSKFPAAEFQWAALVEHPRPKWVGPPNQHIAF